MSIIEATEAMREGQYVRRPGSLSWLFMDQNGNVMVQAVGTTPRPWTPNVHELTDDSWRAKA